MKNVPFLRYSDCQVLNEERAYDPFSNHKFVHKLWALVKYESVIDSGTQCVEFCIMSRQMPDFCGGVILNSPQISFHTGRNSWQQSYVCHSIGDEHFLWGDMENSDDRAIDLFEYTGKKEWSNTEIYNYGLECIAEAALTHLLDVRVRGWVAADAIGGEMSQVHDLMCGYEARLVRIKTALRYNKIHHNCSPPTPAKVQERVRVTAIGSKSNEGTYMNSNSGNDVKYLTGSITTLYDKDYVLTSDDKVVFRCDCCGNVFDSEPDGDCVECDSYDYSESTVPAYEDKEVFGDQLLRTLANRVYTLAVRRFVWSNG